MSEKEIQKQIEMIKNLGKEASKSKESARQILIDAGILQPAKKEKPVQENKI